MKPEFPFGKRKLTLILSLEIEVIIASWPENPSLYLNDSVIFLILASSERS